jgi:iron(III) transport system ATP-binding protein
MASITLAHVIKRYGDGAPAVAELDLTVHDGELLVLLGPSGCGKTTSLRMIAGFERPDAGTIHLGPDLVAGGKHWTPPEQRGIGMVFQDYALFPHLNVAQNIAFGVLRLSRREREARVAEALEAVGLVEFKSRYPHELSGGQQQRVALARAMAPRPRVLLLDEPFSNLDPELRTSLRYEVRSIVQRAKITTVLVTHDQSEAFAMADRIAVMQRGRLHQVATPEELYRRPATPFVAGFVGRAQFLPGVVRGEQVVTRVGVFPHSARSFGEGPVSVLLRPDDLRIEAHPHGDGLVVEREFGGATVRYGVRLPDGTVIDVVQPSAHLIPLDTSVHIGALPAAPVVFAAIEHKRNSAGVPRMVAPAYC